MGNLERKIRKSQAILINIIETQNRNSCDCNPILFRPHPWSINMYLACRECRQHILLEPVPPSTTCLHLQHQNWLVCCRLTDEFLKVMNAIITWKQYKYVYEISITIEYHQQLGGNNSWTMTTIAWEPVNEAIQLIKSNYYTLQR